ncbi:hypothetical protein Dimus_030829 [Dionaea muscipula]
MGGCSCAEVAVASSILSSCSGTAPMLWVGVASEDVALASPRTWAETFLPLTVGHAACVCLSWPLGGAREGRCPHRAGLATGQAWPRA